MERLDDCQPCGKERPVITHHPQHENKEQGLDNKGELNKVIEMQ